MVSFMPKQEKGAFYVPEEQLIAIVEGLRRGEALSGICVKISGN